MYLMVIRQLEKSNVDLDFYDLVMNEHLEFGVNEKLLRRRYEDHWIYR